MPMKKVKIYLEPGQKPPKGVKVEKGPKEGSFFMGTPAQKKAHEKPGAAPKTKPNVNIFDKSADQSKKVGQLSKDNSKKRTQNEPHPHDIQDKEFQNLVKGTKSLKQLQVGYLITLDEVPGAEYRVMGPVKTASFSKKKYLPVKVIKHKDSSKIGKMYDAPVKSGLKFNVVGKDMSQSDEMKNKRSKLVAQLKAAENALDKYEMSRKDSASQWNPGGKSYADPKVIKKYQDKIDKLYKQIQDLRNENTMKTQTSVIREFIRKEIKNVLNENMKNDLVNAFKKKTKNQVMMVYLKNNKEVAIDDMNQLTQDNRYGYGTDKNGNEIEYKFDEVKKFMVK